MTYNSVFRYIQLNQKQVLINQWGDWKGVRITSSINGKPLDRPEFMGLYEKMAQYDLPIWLHPVRDNNIPDYPDEGFSKYGLFVVFGWPYETTLAMARLVLGGDTPALMCGYAFFGADHMLFGSDYPYPGDVGLGVVIKSVELMNVTEEEKAKIFSKNARRIMKLS